MFCRTCGKKIDDDAKFCPFCGGTVVRTASEASGNPKIQPSGYQAHGQSQQSVQAPVNQVPPVPQQNVAVNQVPPIPPHPTTGQQSQQGGPAFRQNQQGSSFQQNQQGPSGQQPQMQSPVHQQEQAPVQDDKKKKSQAVVMVALSAAIFLFVGVAGFFGFKAFRAFREGDLPEPGDVIFDEEDPSINTGADNSGDGATGDVDISGIISGLENGSNTSVGGDTEVLPGNSGETEIMVDNETGRTEIMTDGPDSTANVGGEISVQPSDNTSYKYTSDQLCDMALDYYEAKKGTRLNKAEATDNGDGTVSIHLTGSDGKNSISMWYRIDMNTATGKDELRDTKVDLSDLTPEIATVQNNIEENNAGEDYILPNSDTRKYSKSELSNLSKDQLRLARNEIFARHGRKFRDKELQAYFESKSWYKGVYEPEEFDKIMNKELNSIEQDNLDIIKELEK